MELLRTERLVLREWEASDAGSLIHITSKEHIAYWLPDWGMCAEWVLSWIQGAVKQGYCTKNPMEHFMTWAIVLKQSNKLVGMINIGSDEYEKKEVGTGYFIDMDYENHGYMTEALIAFCDCVFNFWKCKYIAAMVQSENVASIAVLQKVGFRYMEDVISCNGGLTEPATQKMFRLFNPMV